MSVVSYSSNGKIAMFNGERFCLDESRGYYLCSRIHNGIRPYLHRYVYSTLKGEIPDDYDVHHIDHNKANNEPENLQLLAREEHKALHGAELTDEQRQALRDNMLSKAIPAATEWHKSEAGRQWHIEHYEKCKDALFRKVTMECENCGKSFKTIDHGNNRFCSNACKSAWRRRAGLDDVERVCVICGKSFTISRYSKARACSRACGARLRENNKADRKAAARASV